MAQSLWMMSDVVFISMALYQNSFVARPNELHCLQYQTPKSNFYRHIPSRAQRSHSSHQFYFSQWHFFFSISSPTNYIIVPFNMLNAVRRLLCYQSLTKLSNYIPVMVLLSTRSKATANSSASLMIYPQSTSMLQPVVNMFPKQRTSPRYIE